MRMRKLAALLLVAAVFAGCATSPPRQGDAPPRDAREARESRGTRDARTWPISGALDGEWKPIRAELAGRRLDMVAMQNFRLDVRNDRFTVTDRTKREAGRFIVIGGEPTALEVVAEAGPNSGQRLAAIFRRSTTSLEICYDLSGNGRPTEFNTRGGPHFFCIVYALAR
jgi:uncharacterized protein (TIGR03067 family)